MLLLVNKGFSQENYPARWYTSDNNELPQSSVKCLVKDKYNFIWMTTENGIVRYDGNNFLTFNSSNIKLDSYRFSKILGNIENDSLYCPNDKNALVLINQRKIQKTTNTIPIYRTIRNGKRFCFHDGLPSATTFNNKEAFHINLSNKNSYFVTTNEIELSNAKMKRIYKIIYKNNNTFNFFVIDDFLFYLKENGEYDCFSPTQNKKFSGKLNPALFKSKHKLYWNPTSNQVFLTSENNICILSLYNEQLSILPIAKLPDFDKNNIVSILYDNENQKLYLGSTTNGLCVISITSFKTVKKNTTNSDVYYASAAFNGSSIISTDGFILNGEKVIDSLAIKKSKYNFEQTSMVVDANGNIWFKREGSAFCYLKKSGYKEFKCYNFKQPLNNLFVDQNNNIWISVEGFEQQYKSKLYCLSKQHNAFNLTKTLNFAALYIVQYDSNTLYLGSKKGLYKYNIKSKQLTYIKNTEKLNIRSIFIDSGKKIWITTYESGFFLYSDNTIYFFPKDKNGYLNSSHCILEDKKGFFWITTNKGLFQVSRQVLLKYCKDKTGQSRIYYHHYDKENGFLTNEFNGGCQPCGNNLKNGNFVFPSMNGMVFFNPYKINPLLPGRELFIDKVIIDQIATYPKDTIILDNNFQRIQFFIDYAYYGNSNNLNIEAKLFGENNSRWESIGIDKSISFTTLPPGKYELIIRILSGFDSTYKYKKITLIVPPKFYQTLWFKILCGILIIGVIFLIWHVRLYYLRRKNRQLKKLVIRKTSKLLGTITKLKTTKNKLKKEITQQKTLVKSISHDIKSPLKFLTITVRHLFEKTEVQHDGKLKQQVESVYISLLQLYEFVENLVKYSTIFIEGKKLENESYSLYELIERKIQLFEKLALSENTIISNNINKKELVKTNSKALSIIIHNLLDNAVKNTKNGTIELLSNTQGNKLILTIKDNGTGMSKELINYYLEFSKNPILKNHHQGLHMVIELLTIIEGDIKISSEINQGTTIEIIVDYID